MFVEPKEIEHKVIGVDCDLTLTLDTAWDPDEALACKPNWKVIERVNELYKRNWIIVYTARADNLIANTLVWLRRHGIKHHGICNEKRVFDFWIDDRAVNVKDFEEKGLDL